MANSWLELKQRRCHRHYKRCHHRTNVFSNLHAPSTRKVHWSWLKQTRERSTGWLKMFDTDISDNWKSSATAMPAI